MNQFNSTVGNKKKYNGLYISLINAITSAICAASTSQFSTTLYALSQKIGVSEEQIALSDPLKSIAIVIAMLISPVIIKKFGVRITFLLSMILFIIPQILIPSCSSYSILILLKVIQGLSSILFPLALHLIMKYNKSQNMGIATSIFTGIFYAGGSIGGTIAVHATSYRNWEFSYYILAIMMVVVAVIYYFTVPLQSNSSINSSSVEKQNYYKIIAKNKLTWFLVLAFLPTIWTIQAIWSDMVPFGNSLGYNGIQTGGIMGISAFAILVSALTSGKVSDILAAKSKNKLVARISVLATGAVLITVGIIVMNIINIQTPNINQFNAVVFMLSFGAAWGLGSFYCIIPELFSEDYLTSANSLIGGISDIAMPFSPIVIAFLGIGKGQWNIAWFTCIIISVIGLVFAVLIRKSSAR